MYAVCHRCHAELPTPPAQARGADLEDLVLFCPHCSAPQLLLPDHVRLEASEDKPAVAVLGLSAAEGESLASTGVISQPLSARPPGTIDWQAALSSAAAVALLGAIFAILGLKLAFLSFLSTLWIIGAAAIAIAIYARRRPRLRVDGLIGLRIGVATGLLLVVLMAIALAATGVSARFLAHGMQGFDAQVAQQTDVMVAQLSARLAEQQQPADFIQHMLGYLRSPEMRGGLAILYLLTLGALILAFSAAGGAFAGLLHRVRQAALPND